MRIGPVIRNLWRLADRAEDRKIDLEADFDGSTPAQLDAIDRAQTLTAQAMNLLQEAHGILADAFPNEEPKPRTERNPPMNDKDRKTITEAARTMAALLDLVQGFACEAGAEALERYARDPIGLMDRATAALGGLKDLAGEKREEEKK